MKSEPDLSFSRKWTTVIPEGQGEFLFSGRQAVAGLVLLQVLSFLIILGQVAGLPIPLQVSVPIIFSSLLLVPGGLTLLVVQSDITLGARQLLYIAGLSLMTLISIGFSLNIVLPLFGIEQPMTRVILVTSLTIYTGLLGAVKLSSNAETEIGLNPINFGSPVGLTLVLLPLTTVLGVSVLNRFGFNQLIFGVLIVIALIPITVVLWDVPKHWYSPIVVSAGLSILLHKSLWRFSGYSGQPYAIRVWNARRWTPGVFEASDLSASLLPNGLLYPMLSQLNGVHILTQYNVLNPLIVVIIPLALFVAYRTYTRSSTALLGTCIFMFAHPFFLQYPTGGRAATPVVFLALFGTALTDRFSSNLFKTAIGLVFLIGIVVSHYGTSYFVMASLWLTVFLLICLKFIDSILSRIHGVTQQPLANGGAAHLTHRGRKVSASLAMFFSIATIAWYLFANGGRKFDQLPRHARDTYLQLFSGPTLSGRTAARIQRNYGTDAIQYSKYIYALIGIFIAIGILYVAFTRIRIRESKFDDSYLALGSAFLVIFGMTIIARNWGGGRPMMITYVFSAIFAVVGMLAVGNQLKLNRKQVYSIFSVILAVFFLLNGGVASAIYLGGFAPSNVPNEANLYTEDSPRALTQVYKQTDIATHVWFINHYGGLPYFGDTYANRQTDWYRPQITTGTDGNGWGPIEGKPLGLSSLSAPGVEEGYIILLGHNLALNGTWRLQYAPPATSLAELELSERNIIYSTGNSQIYHYHNTSSQ